MLRCPTWLAPWLSHRRLIRTGRLAAENLPHVKPCKAQGTPTGECGAITRSACFCHPFGGRNDEQDQVIQPENGAKRLLLRAITCVRAMENGVPAKRWKRIAVAEGAE